MLEVLLPVSEGILVTEGEQESRDRYTEWDKEMRETRRERETEKGYKPLKQCDQPSSRVQDGGRFALRPSHERLVGEFPLAAD